MSIRHVGIVGASLAGLRSAMALRAAGFDGTITLVGDENHQPYNRPPLSKQFLTTDLAPSELTLPRPGDLCLTLRLGTRALALHPGERRIDTTDGPVTGLDAVIVATGAHARRLDLPALAGVHTLRTVNDALALRGSLARGGPVAVLGAGLIGLEVAASCRELGLEVHVIDPAATPMRRAAPAPIGTMMGELHRGHGVHLHLGAAVDQVRGGPRVQQITLDNGRRLDLDTLVVAVGSVAATEWLRGSGLDLTDGVACDRFHRAIGFEGRVFAVGDVCRITERGEHWTAAAEQPARAVRTLLHGPDPAERAGVPSFWTEQFQHKLQVIGRPHLADAHAVEHRSGNPGWTVTWTRGGELVGAAALDMPGRVAATRRALAEAAA
ncbi:FAD-dependent oxidoreductase [Amycolatopsis sp. GM8]|uniref:NAD(P)/FAD-dependent oxidoreductase n=1 Tax=Amycolatopsis sp. GM8 TaxID=2896530 RepID=UPI001F45F6B1|nr:FAD-dependent oxidoreductase [Amycolatopsis sp. GM8]